MQEEHLEFWQSYLENTMLELNPEERQNHKLYLAGSIDTLYDLEMIPEEIRAELYQHYAM